MAHPEDRRDPRPDLATAIAERLSSWSGPIVLIAHADPDGDALGSTLALKRALDALGKRTLLPLEAPPYLDFLVEPGELSPALDALPAETMLVVLDVADPERAWGAPREGASATINIDHHGTNPGFGDLSWVDADRAATASMVQEVVDALPTSWTPAIATPCLTGILTDTGSFRYASTTPEVLRGAADLIAHGVDYPTLADRLQWRSRGYFRLLGEVMRTVEFPFDGHAVLAVLSEATRRASGDPDADSDDFVSLIRYAEGSSVAVLLKERDGAVKISARTRPPASARRICEELGGGGHVAAAGAKLEPASLPEARERVLQAIDRELQHSGLRPAPDATAR